MNNINLFTPKSKSTKPNIGDAVSKIVSDLFVQCGECPVCGGPIYKPKAKHQDGSEINVGACPNPDCGWKSSIKGGMSNEQRIHRWSFEAKKNTAMDYLKLNSIVDSKEQFRKNFDNFRTDDKQRQELKDNAKELVQEFINHKPTHTVLTGASGRGKSHLAMAMVYEYLEQTNYQKTATFINWMALLNTLKKSMGNNVDDIKVYVNSLVSEFDKSDLIVIDDLGAENVNGKPTEYSANTATSVLSSRSEMNLIVTTNLSAKEIRHAYGDRLLSRMLNHLELGGMNFEGLDDFRMKGINNA